MSNTDTTTIVPEPQTKTSGALDAEAMELSIRTKIIHVLSIYPCISPTMLQIGIGPGLAPEFWHGVMEAMIMEGEISKTQVQAQAPSGRTQTYTRIQLVPKK